MANKNNTVTYTGVTTNLIRRVYEHREKLIKGFSKTYNITKLVYYEVFADLEHAISREKRLKGSSKSRKVKLIHSVNPQWRDLYDEITGMEEISGIMNRDVSSRGMGEIASPPAADRNDVIRFFSLIRRKSAI